MPGPRRAPCVRLANTGCASSPSRARTVDHESIRADQRTAAGLEDDAVVPGCHRDLVAACAKRFDAAAECELDVWVAEAAANKVS